MITTMPAPYREPEDKAVKWVILFILLSLLAHVLIISVILLITRFMPPPKFAPDEPKDSKVTLSLVPAPAAPPKPIFVPTQQQPNVPHTQQEIESAYDTLRQSQSRVARDATSLLPDVEGKPHSPDMRNSPQVPAPPKPQVATTQPIPRPAQPQKPTPPSPKPQLAPKVMPRPLPPQPKPVPPTPPQKPEPQVDPETGLPVLPPIQAQTMATPDQAKPLAPSPSQEQVAGSIHGALGRAGDNSPAAMATDLGKYKQYVYEVVGSYWYPAIEQKFGTIGVGVVHIQFTIHKDGELSDVKVLDGNNIEILCGVSLNALKSPAPFKPFSPEMIKDVGDSYTDDFSFSVY
jgi:outer membrane biosynthesis protein TonB